MSSTELEAQLQRNKAARKLVDEAMDLVGELTMGLDGTYNQTRFWELLLESVRTKAEGHLPRVIDPTDMTKEEAKDFADSLVPWGKHKGERVRDVPTDYWIMLTESRFYLELRRFVRSALFQMLQD